MCMLMRRLTSQGQRLFWRWSLLFGQNKTCKWGILQLPRVPKFPVLLLVPSKRDPPAHSLLLIYFLLAVFYIYISLSLSFFQCLIFSLAIFFSFPSVCDGELVTECFVLPYQLPHFPPKIKTQCTLEIITHLS